MKATLKTNDKLTFEVEAGDQRDMFEQLAKLQEVFGVNICGKCQGTDVRFVVREVDDNKFYELLCTKCHAKLAFGAHKKNKTLFPKRKDGDTYLPDNGWMKWDKEKGKRV